MPPAEESAVRRQRRGMYRLEHRMPAGIDQLAFALGIRTPQHKDDPLALPVEGIDGRVSEALPPLTLMRSGQATLHGKHGVEQQYASVRPRGEAAMVGRWNAQVT